MTKEYRLIEEQKEEPKFPVRKLLVGPYGGGDLTVAHPFFGPGYFSANVAEMGKTYTHPVTRQPITFRKSLTQEALQAVACGFGSNGEVDAKRDVLDPRWFQVGETVRWNEGLFTNTSEVNPDVLREMLAKVERVNGIYLLKNGVAFVPYESFKQGVQAGREFAEGGLARGLEYTQEKVARNLSVISAPEFYSRGVDVFNFIASKDPIKRVVALFSYRYLVLRQLQVNGVNWFDDVDGFASGVLVAKSASAD